MKNQPRIMEFKNIFTLAFLALSKLTLVDLTDNEIRFNYFDSAPSGVKYLVIEDILNRYDGEKACKSVGGHLANLIVDEDFKYVTEKISKPVWIGSFNLKDMNGACLAAYPGGAIYVPKSTVKDSSACYNLMQTLCEIN